MTSEILLEMSLALKLSSSFILLFQTLGPEFYPEQYTYFPVVFDESHIL
jgi:hypothetical protein